MSDKPKSKPHDDPSCPCDGCKPKSIVYGPCVSVDRPVILMIGNSDSVAAAPVREMINGMLSKMTEAERSEFMEHLVRLDDENDE